MIKDLSPNLIAASAGLLQQAADDKPPYQNFLMVCLKSMG